MRKYFILLPFFVLAMSVRAQDKQVIFKSQKFTVYANRVVQGKNEAKVISSGEIISNYQSPANAQISPVVDFKFSINGKDNEMVSGTDHHFLCSDGSNFTPLIKFGEASKIKPEAKGSLKPGTVLKIRVDMRDVLTAFKSKGYFTCFNGEKIYKADFKGVFVAGKPAPLIWDFNNLVNHPELELKDPDGDGIYETTIAFEDGSKTASKWTLTKDISAFPQYHSDYPISDAIYNMSLDEMQHAIETDSTFRTGKEWAGVWTRDISYSIILSMASLQPKVAMYSLMRKVKNDRIIQDTGTGGAYPVSSDRMIWAVAAWEVYKVTGDEDWLKKAYRIIQKSAADDEVNVYDNKTGMVRGESSFLDWREETYPKWMQPADIYESQCLGTNAVHYQVNRILACMAKLLGDKNGASGYEQIADKIRQGINTYLWIPSKGYYGQYLYGRWFKMLSPRSEALGEALTVLFDIAGNHAESVVSRTPVNDFGIPCIYPQIPGIPPYHNNAVWPFVESYWALASAKTGNEASVLRAIAAIYRPAALFTTNKENFVATDGDFAGTQINSSNMLWSLSGNISLVYKLLFGINYQENSIVFKPFVPQALAGKRSLSNFKYRDAVLDIEMIGYGNQIESVTMDGKALTGAEISSDLKGEHRIVISLANTIKTSAVGLQPDYTAPETPDVTYKSSLLSWEMIPGAVLYEIYKNGALFAKQSNTRLKVPVSACAEYQVAAVDKRGVASFASEPVQVIPGAAVQKIEMEDLAPAADLPYKGFSGKGFVAITKTKNTVMSIPVTIDEAGLYMIDFRYANGNGPINTENKCAIRSLIVDGEFTGTVILPQRGKGEWSNWGYTNGIKVRLNKGKHTLALQFKPANENMNSDINEAMVDHVRLIKISPL